MKTKTTIKTISIILMALTFLLPGVARAQVTAVPANDFLNSLGAGASATVAENASLWLYSGQRVYRGSLGSASQFITLHNATTVTGTGGRPGVLVHLLGNYSETGVTDMINDGVTLANAGVLLGFEGPNEPNNFGFTYNGRKGGKGLPAGLTANTISGVISGTPTAAGTYTVALSAINGSGTGKATLTIAISASTSIPVITSRAAVAATNSAFTYTIVATNSPTSYSVVGLPPGLTLSGNTISGTPTPTSGTWSVTLGATNASGTGLGTLTIVINGNAAIPVITNPSMVTATVNSPFSFQIAASPGATSYKATSSWIPVAEYQRDLYAAVKGNLTLMNYPVFASSEGGAENDNIGMQWLTIPAGAGCLMPDGTKYADYANPHNYICGVFSNLLDNNSWMAASPNSGDGAPNGIDGLYKEYGVTWGWGYQGYSTAQLQTLPRVVTETGWATGTASGQLTEDQQGKMYLHLYLSQFKRGWSYTFIFGMEDNASFQMGIFHPDATPKLAGTYIHNMTTILADAVSNTPGSLNYSIPSEPVTVHDLLMQKSDGTFYLAVWDERPATGSYSGTDNVTVNLGGTYSSVKVYDPTVGTSVTQTLNNVSSVALTLSDHPLILAISGLSGGSLPAPWVHADIGTVGLTGSASYSGGVFTVSGAGADIYGTADAFQYAYQPISGDCTITARVASQTNTSTNAKAGVMIRNDLTPGSAHAMVAMMPNGTARFVYRATAGGTPHYSQNTATVPHWVRVTRVGNALSAYESSDNVTWNPIYIAQTITMSSTVYVGLPVCSATISALSTATFDNTTVVP